MRLESESILSNLNPVSNLFISLSNLFTSSVGKKEKVLKAQSSLTLMWVVRIFAVYTVPLKLQDHEVTAFFSIFG